MSKIPEETQPPYKHDLDILQEKSYYHFFVKNYADTIYKGLKETDIKTEGKTVHDIGCGSGRVFPIYKALGIQSIVAFELREEKMAIAREKANKLGLNLTLHTNTNNQPLEQVESESCDIVSIMYALAFIPKPEKQKLIEEGKRIVKPGGIILIIDIPAPSMMSFLNTFTHGSKRNFSSRKEWQNLLSPLTLIKEKGSNEWYFINRVMDILRKCFGTRIYAILNRLAKSLHIPPSTLLMIFQK